MPTPAPSWDTTRVYGTWHGQGGQMLGGSYKITLPVRVTNQTNDVIVPAGTFATGVLNTTAGSPSLDVQVPCNNDPDNSPNGWQVTVEISLTGMSGEQYVINTPVGTAVNLRTVILAATIPEAQTVFIRGVAGGLAELDAAGDVIDAAGVKVPTAAALAAKAPTASPTFTGTVSGVTRAHVGLGSVDNTADASKPVSAAQQTALDAKAPLASPAFTGTPTGLTKAHVGLGSVDNTADTAKPVSTAQAAADAQRWLDRGTFAATTAYAVNDVIRNNNGVYRCMTAHTSGAGGPTVDGDVTYWERVGTVTTTGLVWSASAITSGTLSDDRMPVGQVRYSTNAAARGTARTDTMVIFLTATDPAAVAISGTDVWMRTA